MLLDPSDWSLASEADAVMAKLTGELATHTSTETHGSALELRTDPHEHVGEGLSQLESLRGELAAGARDARLESGGRGDPSVHAVAEHEDLRGRPLPLPVRVDARAGAPRADVRAARACRGARRRERDAGREPPALAPAAAAGAVGELALLAGPRDGPRLGAHSPVPGLPSRGDTARVCRLRRLRLNDRSAAALRSVSRADIPVVGRAAAAAIRDDRGADHGRAEHRGRLDGADRARAEPDPAGGDRGLWRGPGDRPARGDRREPFPRGARRRGGEPDRRSLGAARAGARRARAACSRCAPRTPKTSAAWRSCSGRGT